MKHSSKNFIEIFEEGCGINSLLVSLDRTILKIARGSIKRFNVFNRMIDHEDVAQEVRLRVCIIVNSGCLTGMTGENAYKYLTTVMRSSAVRCIYRFLDKDKKYQGTLLLSSFNLTTLDVPYELPSNVLIRRLRYACSSINNADKVFDYLLMLGDNIEEDFAGLQINNYYNIITEIREVIKEKFYE